METDLEVAQRVVQDDADAFEILLDRYSRRVFETVGRRVPTEDVESVAQDVFVSAFQSLRLYSGRQPFDHWLLRIARRRCCDYWRQRARQPERVGAGLPPTQRDWLDQVSAGLAGQAFEEVCAREEAAEVVQHALGQLDAEDRALIESIYFEDIPLKEVAATFGWSQPKAKVRAFRARRKLRQVIERLMAAANAVKDMR